MRYHYLTRFSLLFALAIFAANLSAQVFVKHDATGTNDGSSWQNAYTNLADALDNTATGEVWVAAGTYHPGGSSADSSFTFAIMSDLSLYGGFNGTETMLSERDPLTNETTLSGDINDDDMEDDFVSNKSDNVQHVVYVDSLLSSVAIDGFTVSGGYTSDYADGPAFFRTGGGIYSLSPILIEGCLFEQNFGRSGSSVALVGQ